MIKELLFWVVIIIIAWFVFSGGLKDIYYDFKRYVDEKDVEFDGNNYLVDFGVTCGMYYKSLKEDRELTEEIVISSCDLSCQLDGMDYSDHFCQLNKLVCSCK